MQHKVLGGSGMVRIRKTLWNNDTEPVIAIMAILLVLGTVNVFSSSFVLSTTEYSTPYHFLVRHLTWVAIGCVCFLICKRVDYHKWRHWMPVVVLLIVGSLVAVLVVGISVNGAKRWLGFGPFTFQPAEFAKLLSLMLASAAISVRVHQKRKVSLLNVQYATIVVMAALTELEPDLGTAAIIVGMPLLMALVVGLTPIWKKIIFIATPLLLVVVFIAQPYRLQRLRVVYDPFSDAQNIGYQTVQSLATIGSGGLWGMGYGIGVSKYDYLPEVHTDFAFASFCQEHGYLGALLVFALFTLLIFFCVRIANKAQDEFGQMLAMGIMILIGGQAIANLFMVSGMFPVVGVPLPFISYGGSSLLVTMIAMGILLNICQGGSKKKNAKKLKTKSEAAKPPRLHLVRTGKK